MTHLAWRTKASIPEATAADADDEAAVLEHLPCNPAAGQNEIVTVNMRKPLLS